MKEFFMLTARQTLIAGAAGMIAGAVSFIPMRLMVTILDVAPFNVPPFKALAISFGINFVPFIGSALHFAYSIAAAIIFAIIFKPTLTMPRALLFGILLWLMMMLVLSPIIGWGAFGLGEAQRLSENHPLHLASASIFMIVTLGFHIFYAMIMGAIFYRTPMFRQRKWKSREQPGHRPRKVN